MANDDMVSRLPSEVSIRNWKEHAKSVVLAGVAGIPYVGGPLASLLSDYLPDWKLQQLEKFLDQLASDFEKLKTELDHAKVQTAEYGLRVEHVLRQVSQTASETKGKAYRAVLVNGTIKNAAKDSEQAFLLSRLDGLDELHIVIIGMLTALSKANSTLVSQFRSHIEEQDGDLIQSAYNDLVQMGFVRASDSASGHMANESDERLLLALLTPLGIRFAEFVTLG